MKRKNLLSRDEMKKVMGGGVPPETLKCLSDCTSDGAACKRDNEAGICAFYPANEECPNGEYSCNLPGGN